MSAETSRLAQWWRGRLAALDVSAMVVEVATAAELSPAEAERVDAYARQRLEAMVELVELLGEDEGELYDGMASHWLELRLEWARYNQNMQYAVMLTGQTDPSLMARAALCAAALTWIEPALSASDLDALQRIAAAPLGVGGERGRMVGTLVSHEVDRARHLASALDMTHEVEEVVQSLAHDGDRVTSERLAALDHSVGQGRAAIVEAQRLDFSLVAPQLERQLLEGLWRRGLAVTASVEGPSHWQAGRLRALIDQVRATVEAACLGVEEAAAGDATVHARLAISEAELALTVRGSGATAAANLAGAERLDDGFVLVRRWDEVAAAE